MRISLSTLGLSVSVIIIIIAAAAIAANTSEPDKVKHPITISNAWVLEAPPGISPLAGYLTLKNDGQESAELIAVDSPDFDRIDIHQTIIEDNVARMEQAQSLTLQAGQTVVFEPGGYHLMLFKPKRSLRAGDQVSFSLKFRNIPSLDVVATVRAADGQSMDHSHHHHHNHE